MTDVNSVIKVSIIFAEKTSELAETIAILRKYQNSLLIQISEIPFAIAPG